MKYYLQLIVDVFEDDRSLEHYKFIVIHQIVGLESMSLREKVHDMTYSELAQIIYNYADCVKHLGEEPF